jgi:hypothetical protein
VESTSNDWILLKNIDEKKELYVVNGKKVKSIQPELQGSIPCACQKEISLKINHKKSNLLTILYPFSDQVYIFLLLN